MPRTLFVLNDPPYGTERSYNALRLAGSLLAEVSVALQPRGRSGSACRKPIGSC